MYAACALDEEMAGQPQAKRATPRLHHVALTDVVLGWVWSPFGGLDF